MKSTMNKTGTLTGAVVLLLLFAGVQGVAAGQTTGAELQSMPPMMDMIAHFCRSTGLYAFLFPADGGWTEGLGRLLMIGIGLLLLYLVARVSARSRTRRATGRARPCPPRAR